MGKILVTGASGHIGRKTLRHLLRRRPAGDLVGLARDPAKASDLAAAGIEIRTGDYFSYGSLLQAFGGVEKMLLVSTHAFTDRETQHHNVITAAREAGVEHLLYTPIIRKGGTGFAMHEVTEPDIFTEDVIKESGLLHTIIAHPPFMESFYGYIGGYGSYKSGVRVPAGSGKVAAATREDLAEAQASILAEAGHENKTYSLHGDPSISFAEASQILSDIRGTRVPYLPVTDAEFAGQLAADGMTQAAASFFLGWMRGINGGEWDQPSGDLERLIGRKPTSVSAFLRDRYSHP